MTVPFYHREIRKMIRRRNFGVFGFCTSLILATTMHGQQALNRPW